MQNDASSTNLESSDERHAVQTYVSDMLALERHIRGPVERQSSIDDASKYPEAERAIATVKGVVDRHISALEARLEALGGHPSSPLKSAWSQLLGAGAAGINSVRKTKISKALRDDYTAFSLAAISYTMLHATALAVGDRATAELARTHLEDIAPVIIQIGDAMPAVVLQELRDDGQNVDLSAADLALANTTTAWRRSSNN